MDNLTKKELRSLTIEKLNGMTEEQLDEIANQVIELLDENDIKRLPKEVRRKLKIIREGGFSFNYELIPSNYGEIRYVRRGYFHHNKRYNTTRPC